MDLTRRAVLVTGAASGLGAACVRRLVAQQAHVIALDRQETSLDLPDVSWVFGDVTDTADVQKAIDLATEFGGLYGVVHCAGVLLACRVISRRGLHPLEDFAKVVHVNLVGTFNVVRLASAAMQQNQTLDTSERGVIVLTSSIAAFDGQIGQAAYSASKGGVAAMCLPLARELGEWGIRVVAIAPGAFDTPMLAATTPAVRESLIQATAFPRRLGMPDEFAHLVQHVFENPMLNGAVIRLDGGLRMPAR